MTKFTSISKVKVTIVLCAIIGSFIVYLDAYSGESISIENTSLNKEFIPVTTIPFIDLEENLEIQNDISKTNYGNAWNSLMKPDIALSPEELKLTEYVSILDRWNGDKGNYQDQTFNNIYVNGDKCQLQWNRMGWAALDRVHPFADSSSYRYFKSGIHVTYGCGGRTEIGSYDYYLYGPLFYYENTWWIFSEIQDKEIIESPWEICEDPCGKSLHALATMVPVDSSDYIYSVTLPRDVGRIND